ncbi:anti-phage-associated DUF1156 domain-containing protein [Methylomicrobium agile]|uniref:anti-phage-associated DUF1156 domain-containing protein n=1 Tax=Methylomicrobium agile TaxID=39774 RepID=UPI0009FF1494|nr:anti-phage-associated DUF1156 domain-containing protein [Methylomicrobium agile]
MTQLIPFALQSTPALIESVFPAQKVSFEAQRERKAGAGQTLTALGSYWKGRKPLILVRAIVLGCLLPPTDDAEKDLEIYEKLLAFDEEGLAKRALANNAFKPKEILKTLDLTDPWEYFAYKIKSPILTEEQVELWTAPFDSDEEGITVRWQSDLAEGRKLKLYTAMLRTLSSYEDRAVLCKRPEELDQTELFADIWPLVNAHYRQWGINANSHQELVEQLGKLRFGHRPKVGDTFCGGGSIPFEAARLGCDVYASDLNPIACMLTWGALNIIGTAPEKRAEIEKAQRQVAEAVDSEITELGIEHDSKGNRAYAYLYCLETRCPQTGWMIPMLPSLAISKRRYDCRAYLIPDYENKRFNIEIRSGVSEVEMDLAERGTVQDGFLIYSLNGKTYKSPIKTLRGDYRDSEGNTQNRLRRWEKHDFKPRPDDIFQERLYCIQWITPDSLDKKQKETFFAAVTEEDLACERQVEAIVAENLAQWQAAGLVPDMVIEPGDKTDELIRTRGWTYWHHLFNARHILLNVIVANLSKKFPESTVFLPALFNRSSRNTHWNASRESAEAVFQSQALNTFLNYPARGWLYASNLIEIPEYQYKIGSNNVISCAVEKVSSENDIWITDPPYADAVHYHEITEFFIAWLRKNPPAPFDEWVWDSRRALAIKGSGDDFRRGMVEAYSAMAKHMPNNGMQCVMFTHQSTSVWSDMIGIFWAAGLQVVGAWYIATETTSELKKGGYVQGTVILMLRKRPAGENRNFKEALNKWFL